MQVEMNPSTLFEKYIEYDEIIDLWYSWLYSRLHLLITKEVIRTINPRAVLDVGCGTGFQSYLHSLNGSDVVGVDSSKKMIKFAWRKIKLFQPSSKLLLFPEQFDFVARYNRIITLMLSKTIGSYKPPKFLVSDIHNLPFRNGSFDHINCCGSVLSLVNDSDSALKKMTKLLETGGTMLLEVDSRWSLDTMWMLLDYFLLNKLGFHTSSHDAWKISCTSLLKNIIVNYPYGKYLGHEDKVVSVKVKLFSPFALKKNFHDCDLKILKKWNIHSLTNILPSTILDKDYPCTVIKSAFKFLSFLEEKQPNLMPGCSQVYLLKKI
jgi:MPBQ/MSBQ methyltransferase